MPKRKKCSPKIVTYIKSVFKFVLEVIAIGIVVGFVGDILAQRHADYYEQLRIEKNNQVRKNLHGFWSIKIKVQDSTLSRYKNTELYDIGTLTVDSNFNVNGLVYRWKEINSDGEIYYPREVRRKSSVSGSIIDTDIILNLHNSDYEGLESIDFLNGTVMLDNTIRGEYFSDVAYQKGIFCAKRVSISELLNDTPCEL